MDENEFNKLVGDIKPDLPNIYRVTSYFYDGTEKWPLYEAVVVASNEEEAQSILIEDDKDERRRLDWSNENTEVVQVGWATGDFTKRTISIDEIDNCSAVAVQDIGDLLG